MKSNLGHENNSCGDWLVRLSRTSSIVFFEDMPLRFKPSFINNGRSFKWHKTVDPHRLYFDLWVVMGGSGIFTVGQKSHKVVPGTGFVLWPQTTATMDGSAEAAFCNFYCYFNILDANGRMLTARQARLPEGPFQFADLPHIRETAHTIERGVRYGTVEGLRQAELAVWQILLECLISDSGEMEKRGLDPRIEKVRRAISNNPEREWSVTGMARMACLSYTQFTRLFTCQVGTSPSRYCAQQRIERACAMLKETGLSLAAIAENVGYKNQHYFNRQFKQHTGKAPGSYRRATDRDV